MILLINRKTKKIISLFEFVLYHDNKEIDMSLNTSLIEGLSKIDKEYKIANVNITSKLRKQ